MSKYFIILDIKSEIVSQSNDFPKYLISFKKLKLATKSFFSMISSFAMISGEFMYGYKTRNF